ncbi:MAG: preprotein translocase subunit YajC [Bacteroidetes bacterium]|nr:preprotein translocase subunit YajC [Bacteroidota bacterium]
MDFILLASSGQPQQGAGNSFFIMIALMLIVMYFFMIRPQVKKNKQQQEFREQLGKGDKVITTGGIHGKITEVRDTTFVIETEGGGKLRIEKSGISMEASAALKTGDKS